MKSFALAALLTGCVTSMQGQREEAVGVAVAFAKRVCSEETYSREASALFNAAADKWTELNRMTRDDR